MKKRQFDYPDNVHFVCSKCGVCCGDTKEKLRHILLLQSEAERISGFVGQQIPEFAEKVEGRAPYVFEMKKTREEGQCLFLEGDKCMIYSQRPIICRFYPFELRHVTVKGFEFHCARECPGIGKGRLLREEHFRKLFQLALVSTRM